MINKDTYKRLTNKNGDYTTVSGSNCPKETKRGYFCDKENCKLRITRECPFLKSFDRLAELEDKIENGTLIFIDEPFYSKHNNSWAVVQRTGDNVITCYMTEDQAKDYKKNRG